MSEKQILVNREYKDNVFRILFRDDKERQMELYHAVSGKKCMDAADLQVVTLKHAIYMGMKNDLAFIVSDDLHLYEHQSSVNPNMPLRFLHYISKEYEGLVESRKMYGSTPVKLQLPYFIVFYNGTKKQPERLILKLSDLYPLPDKEMSQSSNNDASGEISEILKKESPLLELKVLVININPGNNTKFLEQCPTLREYMKYVERVRRCYSDMGLEEAVRSCRKISDTSWLVYFSGCTGQKAST